MHYKLLIGFLVGVAGLVLGIVGYATSSSELEISGGACILAGLVIILLTSRIRDPPRQIAPQQIV